MSVTFIAQIATYVPLEDVITRKVYIYSLRLCAAQASFSPRVRAIAMIGEFFGNS